MSKIPKDRPAFLVDDKLKEAAKKAAEAFEGEENNNTDPQHYKLYKIQPRDFITANNLDYNVGNCVKYLCRYKYKNGLEDLKKAQNYINYLIENYEERNN